MASRRVARHALALDNGQPTLLSVGRLDPIKDLDLLLESVALMREASEDFLALSEGSNDLDAYLTRWEERLTQI